MGEFNLSFTLTNRKAVLFKEYEVRQNQYKLVIQLFFK